MRLPTVLFPLAWTVLLNEAFIQKWATRSLFVYFHSFQNLILQKKLDALAGFELGLSE